jgi:murein tripeptide amidase MpaA
MAITDRMLIGAIANNPATFDGAGEYRCCRTCEQIYYTSAKQTDTTHDEHSWFVLPSLNPDGSNVLMRAFQRFITRWTPERQDELERFALRKGWDMAMELKYGGGALDDEEAAEWQEIINARLEQLMHKARAQFAGEEEEPSAPEEAAEATENQAAAEPATEVSVNSDTAPAESEQAVSQSDTQNA